MSLDAMKVQSFDCRGVVFGCVYLFDYPASVQSNKKMADILGQSSTRIRKLRWRRKVRRPAHPRMQRLASTFRCESSQRAQARQGGRRRRDPKARWGKVLQCKTRRRVRKRMLLQRLCARLRGDALRERMLVAQAARPQAMGLPRYLKACAYMHTYTERDRFHVNARVSFSRLTKIVYRRGRRKSSITCHEQPEQSPRLGGKWSMKKAVACTSSPAARLRSWGS